jgi:hypothetical protein
MNGNTQLARQDQATTIEQVLIGGDLKALQPADRVAYYNRVCESLNLNPLTKPFEYIVLNGKMVLYARKDATEQLRKRDKVSVTIVAREVVEDVYVVTARATLPDGRCDESIGAVSIAKLVGEAKANALMKAETKAKRRVTLSICGLGMLDETEVETIPGAIYPQQEAPRVEVPEPDPIDEFWTKASDLTGLAVDEVKQQLRRLGRTGVPIDSAEREMLLHILVDSLAEES